MSRTSGRYTVCLLVSLLLGCHNCSDQVVSELMSPDAALTATSFVRNCGATTDFSSQVSVHGESAGFREDREIVFIARGRHDLVVSWTGPKALSVRCLSCARKDVFRQVAALGNIDITFDLRLSEF